MTSPPADAPTPPPPTCEDLYDEARARPKSLRLLPSIIRDAVRLVRAAAPRELAISIVLKLISGAGLAVVFLMGKNLMATLLTDGQLPRTVDVLPKILAVAAVISGLGLIAAAGREVREILSETTARYARERIIDVAAAVELQAYETPSFHDRLARAATGQHRPIQLVDGLIGTLGAVAGVAGIVVALLAIQPWLVPVVAAASVPLIAGVLKAGQALFGFHLRMTAATRARNYLFELLTGKQSATEVRAFGLTDHLRTRHSDLYDAHMVELRRTARERFRLAVAGNLALAISLAGSIALLLHLALTGRIALADAATAGAALLVLAERIMMTVMSVGDIYESGLFVEDFTSFLAFGPAAIADRASGPAPRDFGRLVVDDVTFTYPAATAPALRNVSLEVGAGEVIALVGENGSGKTTLAKLLCRLYLPQSGQIRWDEADTATVDPDELRQNIAVIFQDFLHYALTARENIGFGSVVHVDDLEAVRAAARRSGAEPAISALPEGYRTILSPEFSGGRDLSIGQWQRVALARAFIRDAPLVILDEPTAALDPRAEHDLFASIRTLYAGRTVLLISHRYSTVRNADRIYVLRDGQIAEHGCHEELMARGGHYAELFTLQAAAYSDLDPTTD
ncbi:ATP-binding cassette subfamily B protein [Kribbella sp. VKM Ac-2527]|uniref:ATP-binding cassette subfamily B protein n=1 Tax=Kribbella caucasensis TaxID=2512215 RepID=A0A4R6J4T3_9ACTN|nr:ABC transporter ATP-binding protein [Kribbella sp. VKM Ac-2527]TDO30410.1 ATP-binding cassette subfamily B protein [Kribbella sp. VKM Ac-2527]